MQSGASPIAAMPLSMVVSGPMAVAVPAWLVS
jgi:hypothetical protein